jgi:hypothetical protein
MPQLRQGEPQLQVGGGCSQGKGCASIRGGGGCIRGGGRGVAFEKRANPTSLGGCIATSNYDISSKNQIYITELI